MEAHLTLTKHLDIWQQDIRVTRKQLALRSFRWQQILEEKKKKKSRMAATHDSATRFFVQSTGSTMAKIFPSQSGRISLSSEISSETTSVPNSWQERRKKYL